MTAGAPLADLPKGANVFIDANIFVYGMTDQSRQCHELLARCSREDVYGVTLYDVVADVTHRFMLAEAFAKNIITREKAASLKAKPDDVASLSDYWVNTRRVLDLNLVFTGLDDGMTTGAQDERASAGLLTKDSLIVACLRSLGLNRIATADRDFLRVKGILVYRPTDLSQQFAQ